MRGEVKIFLTLFLLSVSLLVGIESVSADCVGTFNCGGLSYSETACYDQSNGYCSWDYNSGACHYPASGDGPDCSFLTSETDCNGYSSFGCSWEATTTTGSCSGTYLDGCEADAGADCSQFTTYDLNDDPAGCDYYGSVPEGCSEEDTCLREDDWGNCQDWGQVCSGTPTCGECDSLLSGEQPPQYCSEVYSSCSGFSESTCTSTDGCTWSEDSGDSTCSSDQTEEYSSCSGTYSVTVQDQDCMGSYTTCTNDPNPDDGMLQPIQFFRSLISTITGNAPADFECTDGYVSETVYCSDYDCNVGQPGCYWEETTTTESRSCSGLTESQCTSTTGCTANYNCVDILDTTRPIITISYPSANSEITGSINSFTFTAGDDTSSTLQCSYSISDSSTTYVQQGAIYSSGVSNDVSFTEINAPKDLSLEITCEDGAGNTNTLSRSFSLIESLKSICQECTSNDQCDSGICAQVLGSSTKRCVSSNNCALDQSTSCEVPSGTTKCVGDSLQTCSGTSWSSSTCDYGCTIGTGSCDAVPEPRLEWRDEFDSKPVISSSSTPAKSELPITYTLSVDYPPEIRGFRVYEIGDEAYGALGQKLVDLSGTSSSDRITAQWTLDEATYDSLDQTSAVVGFIFTYETYDQLHSETLYFDKQETHCDDLEQNVDEQGVDCGGNLCKACTAEELCNNDVRNDGVTTFVQDGNTYTAIDNGEEGLNCGGNCDACVPDKYAKWSPVGPVSYTWEEVYAENQTLDMLLYNADEVAKTFEVRTDDNDLASGINGELIDSDGTSILRSTWTVVPDEFDNTTSTSEVKDGDTYYHHDAWFKVDGESSTIIIKIPKEKPTCGDGTCQKWAGEDATDCFDDCSCLEIDVCSDYGTDLGNCRENTCNVQTAAGESCGVVDGVCAGEILNRQYNGVDIGSCFYAEDTSADTCDDDGLLTYSWTTTWEWAADNSYDVPASSGLCSDLGEGYMLGSDGYCHYDPEGAAAECGEENGKSTTIPCSAQVQLNFFTWKNLVAAILIIIAAYIILNYSKKIKSKKKAPKAAPKTAGKKVVSKKKATKKKLAKKKISAKKPAKKKVSSKKTSKKKTPKKKK